MRPPASHRRNLFRGEAGHNPNPPAHQLAAGLDTLGLQDSRLETLLARTVAVPAARVLRMRRSISVLVAEREDGSPGPVEGWSRVLSSFSGDAPTVRGACSTSP
jgi:hypothetical protein